MTTNRMLASNQTMLAHGWPAAMADPVLVDWLRRGASLRFGGSHNFGLVLRNGGTYCIGAGKPVPGPFDVSRLRNLREIAPTSYFNVPRGLALLLDGLEADTALATTFFSRLRLIYQCGRGASPATNDARAVAGALFRAVRELVATWRSFRAGVRPKPRRSRPAAGAIPLPECSSIGVPDARRGDQARTGRRSLRDLRQGPERSRPVIGATRRRLPRPRSTAATTASTAHRRCRSGVARSGRPGARDRFSRAHRRELQALVGDVGERRLVTGWH